MVRYAVAITLLTVVLPCAPCRAVSSKDKMATCKFGADDQHLQGKERAAFIKKCMSGKDEPRGGPPGAPPAQH